MNIVADEIQGVVENAEVGGELKVLGTKKDSYDGNFVIESQGATKGFSRVSSLWGPKCMTYEQGMETLAQQQANILDHKEPLTNWKPVVENGQFGMQRLSTGRVYRPTEKCMTDIGVLGKGGTWALTDLQTDKEHATKEDVIVFHRDQRDAKVLRDYVNLLLFQPDRVPQDKVRLFRTWDNDNTLRCLLSKDYTIIPNMWMLETVAKLVPGGLLSHWKGDPDTIFGNVLIPDTLRAESDSDYGGMLSIGNSEIGVRRITSCPSVFRAICMNGCIWDAEIGKGIDQVHRKKDGKIDLGGLADQIKYNLEKQIPLIAEGIRLVLATKQMGFEGVPSRNVVAATIQKLNISKKNAVGIMQAYRTEEEIVGNSAFTVMQAITRFGQTMNTFGWLNMDIQAGKIVKMDKANWNKILKLATALDDKELEKIGV
jgi:hypothetical protein